MSPPSADSSPAASWSRVVSGETEEAVAPFSPPAAAAAAIACADQEVAESSDRRPEKGKAPAWSGKSSSNGVMGTTSGPLMGTAESWPALGGSKKPLLRSPPPPPPSTTIKYNDDGSSSSSESAPSANSIDPNPTKSISADRGGGDAVCTTDWESQDNARPVLAPPQPPSSVVAPEPLPPQNLAAAQQREVAPITVQSHQNQTTLERGSSSRGGGFPTLRPHGGSGFNHRPFGRRAISGGPHNTARRDSDRGGYSHLHYPNNLNNAFPPFMQHPSPRHRPQFFRAPSPPPMPPVPPTFLDQQMMFPFSPEHAFYMPQGPQFPSPFMPAYPVTPPMAPALLNPAPLLQQIEYYFDDKNLCKDEYLRKLMDAQGWVPVEVIANFNRVQHLTSEITDKITYILDTLQASRLVEVQGNKLRRRKDWRRWIWTYAHPQQFSASSPRLTSPTFNKVVDDMQNLALGESMTTQ